MLSPNLHSEIRELWNMFWSAGMTNPLVAIEQITYLLFLRQLEKLDEQRIAAGKPSLYTPRANAEGVHTVTLFANGATCGAIPRLTCLTEPSSRGCAASRNGSKP